jgi:hypothetical protein
MKRSRNEEEQHYKEFQTGRAWMPGAPQKHETDRDFQRSANHRKSGFSIECFPPFSRAILTPSTRPFSRYLLHGARLTLPGSNLRNPTLVVALSSTFVNCLQRLGCHRQPPSYPMFPLTTRAYRSSHSSEASENIGMHWPFQHGSDADRRHYQRCSSWSLFGSGVFLLRQ